MGERRLQQLDIVGAAMFVLGCIAFYRDDWYVAGVTFFLIGSLCHLASAVVRRHR